MATLAFAQMAFFVFHDTALGGGSDGIYLYVRPALGSINLENRKMLFYVVQAAPVATQPRVLLLDEPLASMGTEETGRNWACCRGSSPRTRSCSWSATWTPCSVSPTASR